LLDVRRREITPLIPHILPGEYRRGSEADALDVYWPLRDGGGLRLIANLGADSASAPASMHGTRLFCTHPEIMDAHPATLPPWCVIWLRESRRLLA
jgi:hypothetical protein